MQHTDTRRARRVEHLERRGQRASGMLTFFIYEALMRTLSLENILEMYFWTRV